MKIEDLFVEAIQKEKIRIDAINQEIKALKDSDKNIIKDVDSRIAELTNELSSINQSLNDMIKQEISKIDVKAESVDYDVIYAYINRVAASLGKADLTIFKDYIDKNIPPPIKGDKGEKGDTPAINYDLIRKYILDNTPTVEKVDYKRLENYIKLNLPAIKDGIDGVSIVDVKVVKNELIIVLSNGIEKKFKLPSNIQYVGGGGGGGLSKSEVDSLIKQITYTKTEIDNKLINKVGQNEDITVNSLEVTNGSHFIGDVTYEPQWKDNIQWFAGAKVGGTSFPTWADIGNGIYAYRFTTGNELFVTYHVNHDYARGTNAYPHIHFISTTTQNAGRQATWRFEYTIAKGHSQGESLSGVTNVIDMTYTYTGNEIAGEHIVLECSDLQAFDLKEPDTIIMAKITLISETLNGNIFGLCSDLHYQADRDATINKSPDFYN